MKSFLETNGPWEQLVKLKNISIHPMKGDSTLRLNERISITPFLVPHRDEYTETAGFRIKGTNKTYVFIPDIDKWEKWNTPLEKIILESDAVFIDGTFYADGELPGRPMKEVPHPFITETMELLKNLPAREKSKVYFIHLNHTNPALKDSSEARINIAEKGFRVVSEQQTFNL
jgi:pyrroloquinoline quinone biosynthesis protein B